MSEDDKDFLQNTLSIIKEKISKENILPDQIIIAATTISMENSYLGELNSINGITVSRERNNKQILKTTIRKFKGLEADILLLVDVDFYEINSEVWRKLFIYRFARERSMNFTFFSKNNSPKY